MRHPLSPWYAYPVLALALLLAGISPAPSWAVPIFKAPFLCNQTWTASTYPGHGAGDNAVDFNLYPGQSDLGQPALADAPGEAQTHWDRGGGNMVTIDHRNGWRSVYAHLLDTTFSGKKWVSTGEQIGRVGATGSDATAPHLHYAQKLNGVEQPVHFDGSRISVGRSYTANDPKVRSTNCGGTTLNDGDFIFYQGNVYRIAGGAPIYVSTWNAFGGPQPLIHIGDADWVKLPQYPRDGTFIQSIDGAVFRMAGGAPVYVSDWNRVGGMQPHVIVDSIALHHAGGDGVYSHVRAHPADGTFLITQAGDVYCVAGGAPVYVSNWDHVGGVKPHTQVDSVAVDRADSGGYFSYLRYYPPNGTVLRTSAGKYFRVFEGTPVTADPAEPSSLVDFTAVQHAGEPGPLSHLHASGSFVSLPPSRVLDTRTGTGATGPVSPNTTITIPVTNRAGVPSNVSAVVLNLTVTDTNAPGYITAWPSGTQQPTTSNINFQPHQPPTPNLAIVKVGTDGKINLINASAGTSHIIADIAGYYRS